MPCTGPLVRPSEKRGANIALFWADMKKRPEIELDDSLFAEPIGRRQGGQYAKCTNATAAIKSERQEEQFQFDFSAAFGASQNACDNAHLFVKNDSQQVRNLLATCFAPQVSEGLAFDFTSEQRTDASTAEAKPQVIDEIRCQQKRIAKNVTNIRWIDFGSRGGPAAATPPVPVVKQCLR